MNKVFTSESITFFRMGMRWPKGQRILCIFSSIFASKSANTLPVIARSSESTRDDASTLFAGGYRRGNLLSLTKNQEPFNIFNKNSFLQTQCNEIASGMQQLLTKFIATLCSTVPRNDEIKCEGRLLQTSRIQQRIEIIL
jgi:hypothetical protein